MGQLNSTQYRFCVLQPILNNFCDQIQNVAIYYIREIDTILNCSVAPSTVHQLAQSITTHNCFADLN